MDTQSRAQYARIIQLAGIAEHAHTTLYRPWGNDETPSIGVKFSATSDIYRFFAAAGSVLGVGAACELAEQTDVAQLGRWIVVYLDGVQAEEPERGPGSVEVIGNLDGEPMFRATATDGQHLDFYVEADAWAAAAER